MARGGQGPARTSAVHWRARPWVVASRRVCEARKPEGIRPIRRACHGLGGRAASSARHTWSNSAKSSRTRRHKASAATRVYSWQSTSPIPATFRQGISGCRAFRSSGRWRLASETISRPRSTCHRFWRSPAWYSRCPICGILDVRSNVANRFGNILQSWFG
jgi:hypothetical protein